jgi:hypothetical protein
VHSRREHKSDDWPFEISANKLADLTLRQPFRIAPRPSFVVPSVRALHRTGYGQYHARPYCLPFESVLAN